MTSETVRRAAAMPDMNHRDPAFVELLRDTKRRLLGVYPEMTEGELGRPGRKGQEPKRTNAWRPFLIGGSGTAAVEAMITSCVKTGPVLLVDSGYYSGRMRSKLEAYGYPYRVLDVRNQPQERIVELVSESIEEGEGRYEALLTTHHETSTGRLNPIGNFGAACERHNVKLLVDAMSSFGADEIDLENVHALASSANKCLHGLPGLSFVLARDWLADEMANYPPRGVYLNLPLYAGESPPLTPPVPILSALHEALKENAGGAAARRAVYRDRAGVIRSGLKQRGFRFLIEESEMSCTLTTASIPEGWTSERWFDANLEAGFMIYKTKGDLEPKWFQVANMGELTEEHLHLWLAAVDDLIG